MIDVKKILYDICEDENVWNPDFDLIESDLLDSFAMIELFAALEEEGILLQPTRVDRNLLRTSGGIEKLVKEYLEKKDA